MNELPILLYDLNGSFIKEMSFVPSNFTGSVNDYGFIKYYCNGKRINIDEYDLLVNTMKLKRLI